MTASANTRRQQRGENGLLASPMLTREDTAAYLAVSKRTLDRLVQAGEIPAYRIGGHRRFRIEDIESFVASRME